MKTKKLKFIHSLSNDLNTASAIAIIYEITKPLKNFVNQYQRNQNEIISKEKKYSLFIHWQMLVELSEILGLKKEKINKEFSLEKNQILALIEKRRIAKKEKNYNEADSIREYLKENGVELIDQSPEITKWIKI